MAADTYFPVTVPPGFKETQFAPIGKIQQKQSTMFPFPYPLFLT